MRNYEVKSKHTVDEIFNLIKEGHTFVKESHANLESVRISNFFYNGVACVTCNIKGNEFRVERHANANYKKSKYGGWHLNLYSNRKGVLILMTLDHIIPRSKGGKKILSNAQPMCEGCNGAKGNLMPGEIKTSRPKSKSKHNRKHKKGGTKIAVIDWNRMSFNWMYRCIKHIIFTLSIPSLPKVQMRRRNMKWYHLSSKSGT